MNLLHDIADLRAQRDAARLERDDLRAKLAAANARAGAAQGEADRLAEALALIEKIKRRSVGR